MAGWCAGPSGGRGTIWTPTDWSWERELDYLGRIPRIPPEMVRPSPPVLCTPDPLVSTGVRFPSFQLSLSLILDILFRRLFCTENRAICVSPISTRRH